MPSYQAQVADDVQVEIPASSAAGRTVAIITVG